MYLRHADRTLVIQQQTRRTDRGSRAVRSVYISHLSPSTMSCIASVHPLITWLGANDVGEPRAYELSKVSPDG